MNKIVSALLGALALVAAASATAATPTLTDGARAQTVQYLRYGRDRHYRRHSCFHHRPHLFGHRHRGFYDRRGFRGEYRR